MNNTKTVGKILEYLGETLQDETSPLYKEIGNMSEQQLYTVFQLFRIITSPPVQVLYISDLAMRWGVTNRTIQNWVHDKVIPHGRESDSDNRMRWLESEIDKIEPDMIRLGYVKEHKMAKKTNRILARLQDFV